MAPAQNEVYLVFSPRRATADFVPDCWALLSSDERERAQRFCSDELKNDFVVARALLRLILGFCSEADPANLEFHYASHGKPMLADGASISFNLAHSEDMVVYAVGVGQQIGVDIERVLALEHMVQIAQRSFCPEEYRDWLAVPEGLRAKAFFDCWTRKEAFVKAVGQGLSYPLDRFQVTVQPGQAAALVKIDGRASSQAEWSLHDVSPSEEYAAALAVEKRTCSVRTWKFKTARECAAYFRCANPQRARA